MSRISQSKKRKSPSVLEKTALQKGIVKTREVKKRKINPANHINTLPPQSKRIRKTIRRKRNTNPFVKKRKINHGSNNILAMRTDKSRTVTNKNGETVPLKTSAMINRNALTIKNANFSQDVMEKNFIEWAEKNPTHRQVKITKTSDTGSPTQGETPDSRTKLYRCANYGSIIIFSNQNRIPVLNPKTVNSCRKKLDFAECAAFKNSEEYQKIKKFFEEVKKQQITITPQLYAKTDNERRRNNFKRCISQNEVMSVRGRAKEGSATKYANKLLLTNLPWEWGHEIGHDVAGALSQCMENLAGITKPANTDMIFAEKELRYLALCYPEGFNLTVEAELMELGEGEYSQVASIIKFKISTRDFKFSFYFDAQNEIQPHLSFANYFSGLIHSLVEACKPDENTIPDTQTPAQTKGLHTRLSYFYHTPDTKQAAVSTEEKKKKVCHR